MVEGGCKSGLFKEEEGGGGLYYDFEKKDRGFKNEVFEAV